MIRYLVNRLWNGALVLFGVVTVVFFIFNLKPGDPARMLADQRGSEEALQNIRKDLGLDLSLGKRYVLYLNDLSPISIHSQELNSPFHYEKRKYGGVELVTMGPRVLVFKAPYLRRSYRSRRDVRDILVETFPTTAILALVSILLALLLGVALGTWAAIKKGSLVDVVVLGLSAVGMSGPSFFMAVIISWVGGFLWFEQIPIPWVLLLMPFIGVLGSVYWIYLKRTPEERRPRPFRSIGNGVLMGLSSGAVLLFLGYAFGIAGLKATYDLPGTGLPLGGSLIDLDPFNGISVNPKHLILPAITLGIRPLSVVVQLTRSSLLEVLSQDHVRTARAKGLSEMQVVVKHGLRNALISVVTTISGWLASLLAGAVFVEFVFGWRGMGLEVFTALENEDFPVVIGAVLVFSAIFVTVNMFVDLIYGILDPRVRIR